LTVDIGKDLKDRMDKLIPWGMKGRLVIIILTTILDIVEKHGDIAIGALLSGRVTVLEMLTALDKGGGNSESKA
jgi:hypothetical protein